MVLKEEKAGLGDSDLMVVERLCHKVQEDVFVILIGHKHQEEV